MNAVMNPAARPAADADAAGPALHPTPRWAPIVREQLGAVGIALRGELIAAGLLMLLVTATTLLSYFSHGARAGYHLIDFALAVVMLGLFAPVGVWKGEAPARRAYFWAMPVDRPRHTLLRVFSGWVWLMAVVGAYVLWVLLANAVTGSGTGVGADWAQGLTRQFLPPGRQRMMEMRLGEHPWFWLVPFTAATATYLVGSVVVLASNHPWRWFAGAVFSAFLVLLVGEAGGLGALTHGVTQVLAGPYGLVPLLTGMATTGAWAASTALWLTLALVGVVWAAHRRPDR